MCTTVAGAPPLGWAAMTRSPVTIRRARSRDVHGRPSGDEVRPSLEVAEGPC
ncbi:hypothetical protein ACFV08_27995 [Streptomyces fradiae]|uniref:hypothetical protein n=1 Tax=Streptomyces fradiae TaxID=1906 RepID=UPI0036C1DBC5